MVASGDPLTWFSIVVAVLMGIFATAGMDGYGVYSSVAQLIGSALFTSAFIPDLQEMGVPIIVGFYVCFGIVQITVSQQHGVKERIKGDILMVTMSPIIILGRFTSTHSQSFSSKFPGLTTAIDSMYRLLTCNATEIRKENASKGGNAKDG